MRRRATASPEELRSSRGPASCSDKLDAGGECAMALWTSDVLSDK